jgi:hypothetical protein
MNQEGFHNVNYKGHACISYSCDTIPIHHGPMFRENAGESQRHSSPPSPASCGNQPTSAWMFPVYASSAISTLCVYRFHPHEQQERYAMRRQSFRQSVQESQPHWRRLAALCPSEAILHGSISAVREGSTMYLSVRTLGFHCTMFRYDVADFGKIGDLTRGEESRLRQRFAAGIAV